MFFCKAGCRFWFPAEHCENHRTAQRVSPTEKERKDSDRGPESHKTPCGATRRKWKRSGEGREGSPEGTYPLKENCGERFEVSFSFKMLAKSDQNLGFCWAQITHSPRWFLVSFWDQLVH